MLHCPQAILDGSYLKVEVDLEDGVPWEQKQWRLYFPDGKRVVGRSINAQAIYDANGNMILINNVYAPSNPPDMFWLYTEIEDEIGGPARRITIQHSTDAYSQNVLSPLRHISRVLRDRKWCAMSQSLRMYSLTKQVMRSEASFQKPRMQLVASSLNQKPKHQMVQLLKRKQQKDQSKRRMRQV